MMNRMKKTTKTTMAKNKRGAFKHGVGGIIVMLFFCTSVNSARTVLRPSVS
jgi:hypothetical protein